MEKTCESCGRTFTKPPTVSKRRWEQARFCSHRCHGDALQQKWEPKQCEMCGRTFERGEGSKRGESRALWERRRYCSTDCAYKARVGAGHWNFKNGGRFKMPNGYIGTRLFPDHPLFAMAQVDGRIMEHRLVMAEHLGRPLYADETIHHKNGDRTDNRLENLELRVGRHGRGADSPHCRTCSCFAAD